MGFTKDGLLKTELQSYTTIGGWLIIVVIFTVGTCLASAVLLITNIIQIIPNGLILKMFTSTFKQGNELIPVYYSVSILGYLFLFIFSLITTIKLLKKKRESKPLIITLYFLNTFLLTLLYVISKKIEVLKDENSISTFSSSILPAIIWTVYLLKSERVKNTLTM
jgi:Protein of unknown function (DUF2569)